MKKFFNFLGAAALLMLATASLQGQSVLQTTDVVVVYSNGQPNATFENVNRFYFQNQNLVIDQQGETTEIAISSIRRLELEAITTPNSVSEWDENTVLVYPNPTSDKLYFSAKNEQEVNVSVFSMDGRRLLQKQMNTSDNLDVSFLSKGIYVIKINQQTYKFSKL